MKRKKRLVAIGGGTATLAVAWWLFGFEIHRTGTYTLIPRRVFGRVTQVHLIDGLAERERYVFPWSEPYRQKHPSPLFGCAAIFPKVYRDANADGRWDTWEHRTAPDTAGHCRVEYRVDTDLDGRPDWMFADDASNHEATVAMMKARRGF
jgi:hypothetical protein